MARFGPYFKGSNEVSRDAVCRNQQKFCRKVKLLRWHDGWMDGWMADGTVNNTNRAAFGVCILHKHPERFGSVPGKFEVYT